MQVVIVLLTALLLALLGWAATQGGGADALAWLTSNPWGIATTADLYLGICLFGSIVWRLERSATKALLWTIPAFVLGNPVPAIYVLLNLKRIPALRRAD